MIYFTTNSLGVELLKDFIGFKTIDNIDFLTMKLSTDLKKLIKYYRVMKRIITVLAITLFIGCSGGFKGKQQDLTGEWVLIKKRASLSNSKARYFDLNECESQEIIQVQNSGSAVWKTTDNHKSPCLFDNDNFIFTDSEGVNFDIIESEYPDDRFSGYYGKFLDSNKLQVTHHILSSATVVYEFKKLSEKSKKERAVKDSIAKKSLRKDNERFLRESGTDFLIENKEVLKKREKF